MIHYNLYGKKSVLFTKIMKESIKRILARKDKGSTINKDRAHAAILLLFYQNKSEYYILFTKRSTKVDSHKGEISFPGGRHDNNDITLVNTALRENFEEIGIKKDDVEVFGELDDVVTITSNYIITPFVATFPYPYEFIINKDEVEEIIEVSISSLLDKDIFWEELWIHEGRNYSTYFYRYQNHIIWGATAVILKQFLDLLPGLL